VGVGFFLIALASLVLFVLACIWAFQRKIHPAYVPESTLNAVFLEGFTIYLVLFLLMGPLLRFLGLANIQWIWLALLILPVVFAWAAWRGVSIDRARKALGWHTGRG